MSGTSNVLSSWKEIAQYLGKGIRTVQRWERDLGLPTHRPRESGGTILAFREELDAWMHRNAVGDGQRSRLDSITRLKRRIAELEKENQRLRRQIPESRSASAAE